MLMLWQCCKTFWSAGFSGSTRKWLKVLSKSSSCGQRREQCMQVSVIFLFQLLVSTHVNLFALGTRRHFLDFFWNDACLLIKIMEPMTWVSDTESLTSNLFRKEEQWHDPWSISPTGIDSSSDPVVPCSPTIHGIYEFATKLGPSPKHNSAESANLAMKTQKVPLTHHLWCGAKVIY